VNHPPFLLIRPVVRAIVRHQRTPLALVDDLLLALGVAFGIFVIKQRRLFGGTALRGQRGNRDIPMQIVFGDRQLHARFDFLAGFHALVIHMHFAAGDRFLGQSARLEKARGPEPFIEAERVEFGGQLLHHVFFQFFRQRKHDFFLDTRQFGRRSAAPLFQLADHFLNQHLGS
jgi:hypothetical protein